MRISSLAMQAHELVAPAQTEQFVTRGYTVLRKVIPRADLDVYATYALLQRFTGHYTQQSETSSLDRYADVLGESLLLHLQPVMESVSGRRLSPTYSYLRIYQTGAVVEKHIDRPACEISASLTLGYEAPTVWPLWLESGGEAIEHKLDMGDLLVYRGCDLQHWREQFTGRHWTQMFFHYVDADGPLAAHKFDRRVLLGLPRHVKSESNEADAQS